MCQHVNEEDESGERMDERRMSVNDEGGNSRERKPCSGGGTRFAFSLRTVFDLTPDSVGVRNI